MILNKIRKENDMFIGRKKELESLNELYRKEGFADIA
jgi:hypothetical protein